VWKIFVSSRHSSELELSRTLDPRSLGSFLGSSGRARDGVYQSITYQAWQEQMGWCDFSRRQEAQPTPDRRFACLMAPVLPLRRVFVRGTSLCRPPASSRGHRAILGAQPERLSSKSPFRRNPDICKARGLVLSELTRLFVPPVYTSNSGPAGK